jgi:hypothetical protein
MFLFFFELDRIIIYYHFPYVTAIIDQKNYGNNDQDYNHNNDDDDDD